MRVGQKAQKTAQMETVLRLKGIPIIAIAIKAIIDDGTKTSK